MVRKNQTPPLGKDLGTFRQLFLTTEDPTSIKNEGKKSKGRSPPATGGSGKRRKGGKAPAPAEKMYLDGVQCTPPRGAYPFEPSFLTPCQHTCSVPLLVRRAEKYFVGCTASRNHGRYQRGNGGTGAGQLLDGR